MSFQVRRGSIFAKLLAKENIKLSVKKDIKTAYFDLKGRTVYLPNWDVSDNLYDMLSSHEVSHALFTPQDKWFGSINNHEKEVRSFFKSILNICEDPRVDRLMQRKYPGARKWYYGGYQELYDRDFFKLEGKDPQTLPLAGRINYYFKTREAKAVRVTFTQEEQKFIDDIDASESFDDVIDVAERLFKYSMENNEYQQSDDGEMTEEDWENLEISVVEDDGEGNEEIGEKWDGKKKIKKLIIKVKKGKELDDPDKIQIKLKNAINEKINIDELFLGEYSPNDFVMKFEVNYNGDGEAHKVNAENKKLISFCVSEFERKKRAREYSRVQEGSTGRLDTNRLHLYKLTDDIFLRNAIVSMQKNHGFVYLMDLSSSMTSIITQVFKQVLILSVVCKRLNVPFEVYGFSDNPSYLTQKKLLVNEKLSECCIIKFVDSSMSFANIVKTFDSVIANNIPLHGTPLSTSLIGMRHILENFRTKYPIDILNFILLSDGGCNQMNIAEGGIIVDTKSQVRLGVDNSYCSSYYRNYVSPLFEILKARTNCRISVYYLLQSIKYNMEGMFDGVDETSFDDKGFIKFKDKFSADSVFYVNSEMIFNEHSGDINKEQFLMRSFIESIS